MPLPNTRKSKLWLVGRMLVGLLLLLSNWDHACPRSCPGAACRLATAMLRLRRHRGQCSTMPGRGWEGLARQRPRDAG